MKNWLLALFVCCSYSALAAESTLRLEEICHKGAETSVAEVRASVRASVADIFRVTKDSEERGLHKFSALLYAVDGCQSEVGAPVVAQLMASVEPAFHICHRSTPRCISALANILYRFDHGAI